MPESETRKRVMRWVVGVVVAFLLMSPHLRMYSVERTRYFAYWGRGDAVALACIMLLGGTLLFLAHHVAHAVKRPIVDRAANAVFAVVFGGAVIVNLGKSDIGGMVPWSSGFDLAILCGVCGLALLGLVTRWDWPARAGRMACLIISPTVPLIIVQLLSYPPYSVYRETLPGAVRVVSRENLVLADAPADVYMFIFDGCSHQRTLGSPELDKELPHLARLAAQSTVYHEAYSPYEETRRSLPGILFQTHDEYMPVDGRLGFRTKTGTFEETSQRASLYSRYKRLGYTTYMVGWDHPYRRMLGEDADFCFSAPFKEGNGDDQDFLGSIKRHLWLGFAKCAVATPKPAGLRWRVDGYCGLTDYVPVAIARLAAIHDLAMRIVRDQKTPTFAVFHYSVPHAPMIFTRDGVDLEVVAKYPMDHTDRDHTGFARPDPQHRIMRYTGNLQYMDTLLGEVIETMKAANRYDDALIIITSDHTWRVDPRLDHVYAEHGLPYAALEDFEKVPRVFKHVPLLVKHARQRQRVDIHEPIEVAELFGALRDGPTIARDQPRGEAALAGTGGERR